MRSHVISLRFFSLLFLPLVLLFAACGSTSSTASSPVVSQATAIPVLDAYGTPITIPDLAPQRIISLVPNMSEILASLKLQDKVVGVDYYTNYPSEMASKSKISDANGKFNVESIVGLHPDLILSWGGQTQPIDPQLTKLGLHVVDLPTCNFTQLLPQIQLVGRITHTQNAANALVAQMQQQIQQIKAKVVGTTTETVLLEVDDSTAGKPYVFGGGSFGDELLQDANGNNIFHSNTTNGGYPQVTDEAVIAADPQFVILTEDPLYGGKADTVYKRPNWSGIVALKMHQVYHLNSDILQRPGPRLVEGLQCVAQLLHADKFSGALPDYCQASV